MLTSRNGKHGSLCIAARRNKLRVTNFREVMYEKYIKHACFLFIKKISIFFPEKIALFICR